MAGNGVSSALTEEEHEEEEGLEGSIIECETGLSDLEHSMWLWIFLEIEQDVADLDR